jgi:hypothetical protein
MAQQYAVTLDLLLRALQAHPHTSQIWAMVPAEILPALTQKAMRGTLCRVSLVVEQGQLTFCAITDHQGLVLLEGREAFASVWSCEQVVWTVQTQQTSESQRVHPRLNEQPFLSGLPAPLMLWSMRPPPCLTHTLDAHLLAAVSRKQRQILVLLDGRRTVNDLCTLLNLPSEQVETVLSELETRSLITTKGAGTPEERR